MTQLRIYFFIIIFLSSYFSIAQGFLHTDGQRIVNGENKEIILRGIGLGGWMLQEPYMLKFGGIANNQTSIRKKIESIIGVKNTEAFYEAWLNNHCTKNDIDSLAAWGFNSVRLPMHFNLYTPPVEDEKDPEQNTWLKKGFILTDSLLKWCAANNIYLILDLHAAPGGQGYDIPISDRDTSKPSLWKSEANRIKTIALWKELAKRYANEKWIGAYDLINEPNWGFENPNDRNGCNEKINADLRSLLVDITKAIRSVDNNHMIIIEGNCWGNNYKGIFPLWDKNITVSFHKYWNYNQRSSIEPFLKIREEQNVPIWCGESGENSNVWFTDAITLLEANKIGWAWWPLKKLGLNNPLEMVPPTGYEKLLLYFKGDSVTIDSDEATKILMDFTESTNIKNNTYKKDVVDAMFRQVKSAATVPFTQHFIRANYLLFASDYDMGKIGFAYQDADAANYWVSSQTRTTPNKGGKYRNDGVDIGICNDETTNGYFVGWTEAGEWLQYTVNTEQDGRYQLTLRARNTKQANQGIISLTFNNVSEKENIPLHSPLNQWSTIEAKKIWLRKGENKLKLFITNGEVDLNYIQFTKLTN